MDSWIVLLAAATNFVTVGMILVIKYDLIKIAQNVLTIEKATNSMKDALVASTAKASNLEGREQGRKEDEIEKREERIEDRRLARAAHTQVAPVPVLDERTAKAAEEVAEAAKKSAKASERIADATEQLTKENKET